MLILDGSTKLRLLFICIYLLGLPLLDESSEESSDESSDESSEPEADDGQQQPQDDQDDQQPPSPGPGPAYEYSVNEDSFLGDISKIREIII